MSNMTVIAKSIAGTVLSVATILGCLALFITVTRSRERDEHRPENYEFHSQPWPQMSIDLKAINSTAILEHE